MSEELDLVARLRKRAIHFGGLDGDWEMLQLLNEAADALAIRDKALGWQTIDADAMNGDWVILFAPDSTEPKVFIGRWIDDESNPFGGAWWPDHDDDAREIDVEPTLWRTCPEPPAAQALSPNTTDAK